MTASSRRKNMFNEATRVQMPALVHLTKLGYTYFGKISEEMAETVYEPDTNILIEVFKKQFEKLNPERAGEALQVLREIDKNWITMTLEEVFIHVLQVFLLYD